MSQSPFAFLEKGLPQSSPFFNIHYLIAFAALFFVPVVFVLPSRGSSEVFIHASFIYASLLVLLLSADRVALIRQYLRVGWPVLLLTGGALLIYGMNYDAEIDQSSPIKALVEIQFISIGVFLAVNSGIRFQKALFYGALLLFAGWLAYEVISFYSSLKFQSRLGISLANDNANVVCYFLVPMVLFAASLLVQGKARLSIEKVLLTVFVLLGVFAVFMTKSRAGVGGMLVALSAMLVFHLKWKGVVSILALAGVMALLVWQLDLFGIIETRIFTKLDVRVEVWRQSIEIWLTSPWIGTGEGNYKYPIPWWGDYKIDHAHNLWLWALAFGGIAFAGLLAGLVLLGGYFSGMRAWKEDGFVVFWLLYGLTHYMADGGKLFTSNYSMWLPIWIPLIFALMKFEPLDLVNMQDKKREPADSL